MVPHGLENEEISAKLNLHVPLTFMEVTQIFPEIVQTEFMGPDDLHPKVLKRWQWS